MTSRTTRRFREALAQLPASVQEQARDAYRRFSADPNHPSLHFKRIQGAKAVYSARIGRGYRALALLERDDLVWFWIGSHSDYDRLIALL